MKKLLLVLFIISIGFGSFNFVEKAHFEFGNAIDDVERHWYDGRWIQEVRTGDSVFLMIDDIIDTNYIEGISDGEVLVCGDSIVAITKEVDSLDTICFFQNIYPTDSYTAEMPGKDFAFCMWSDSLEEVLYIKNEDYRRMPFPDDYKIQIIKSSDNRIIIEKNPAWASNIEFYPSLSVISSYFRKSKDLWSPGMGYLYSISGDYHDRHMITFQSCSLVSYVSLGYSGYIANSLFCDEIMTPYPSRQSIERNTIYLGESIIDINGDGFIDKPSWNVFALINKSWHCHPYTPYGVVTDTLFQNILINLTSGDSVFFDYKHTQFLFMANFLDSSANCFMQDSGILIGDSFEDLIFISTFPENFEYASKISDLDNDGIHE
ncbi:MAG: hypothetical protein ACLFSQ_05690, partial [Candidatus Zixiibacteriota bacterium]